jgi:hypothetical protein
MEHGTKIADICYEYFEDGQKKHRTIGSLFYFRNHSGGCPSAQLRLDMIPSVAWQQNPDVYFIGNFIPSEKLPEAPYVCGNIYAPSDKRGDRTYIGHIASRETPDGTKTQFYLQLFGVPLREIKKGLHKAYMDSISQAFDELTHYDDATSEYISNEVERILGKKKHSLYLGIELEG